MNEEIKQKQGTKKEEVAKTTKESQEVKIEEKKPEVKKDKKQVTKQEIIKKDKAFLNAKNLQISTKHSIAICKFIRGKTIEKAIRDLEQVVMKKKAVPMKGEIPHRKGNIERGRYPEKAVKEFIKLLRSLNSNSVINSMERVYISKAIPNQASRPHRRFSGKFKRTHVYLEALEVKEKKVKNEENEDGGPKRENQKKP